MNTLLGRVALVTGSSRGIGAEIARLFAAEGAAVAIHGRDRERLARVHASVTAAGHRAVTVAADVTHWQEVEMARLRVEAELGPIDILVANAGANPTDPGAAVEDLDPERWQASVDANLTSTFLTIKSVLPGMKTRGRGSIITMSSAAARRPTGRSPAPYTAAKAGIERLTQIVAAQSGPSGVRVNCISPETIETHGEAQIPPQFREQVIAMHPLRRLGSPADVAHAALFLASDAASWITGVVLDVAGGAVLR